MGLKKVARAMGFRGEKVPADVSVQAGRKDPRKGFPVDKDRLWLMNYSPDHQVSGKDARSVHPAAGDGFRRIFGHIVHKTTDDAATGELVCYSAAGLPAPPTRAPACMSKDGKTASRWDPRKGDRVPIACPNRSCAFAKDCKPRSVLVFRLSKGETKEGHLVDLPPLLARFQSGSYYTYDEMLSFLTYLEGQAEELGAEGVMGAPVCLTVVEKRTDKGKFPVVHFSAGGDTQGALLSAARMLATIRSAPALPAGDMDEYEDTDGDDLSGVRVLAAPAVETDGRVDITVPHSLTVAPDGSPLCRSCGSPMVQKDSRKGAWLDCEVEGCGFYVAPDGTEGTR